MLVAKDGKSDEGIATEVGISKRSLEYWKKRPNFAARVAQHKEAFREAALTSGFADKRARLQLLDAMAFDVAARLQKNGYVREEVKIAANGEHISYEVFDQPAMSQLRGLLDDIAKELGDRKTISETTHKFDPRKEAEAIAAEIGKPELVEQIHQDLLLKQEAR